mgnify:CR=1 FL=1
MLIQAPKGTRDILPSEIYKWRYVENIIDQVCMNFGYKEIRIPVFEHTELFERGVGDTTDIVQKEMYTFKDKGGRSITLRPEGTAGVVRSYIQNGMASLPQPVKLYYKITAYRYENVQKGRYREFNQFGVEAFGSPGPSIDIEIISLVNTLFERLSLKNIGLFINSIGCPECRSEYNKKLKAYLEPILGSLCPTCRDRYERNPLRILDCKEKACQELTADAPALLDHLCSKCEEHFKSLRQGLDALGIAYKIDKRIVRGLDYYTRTVFEFVSDNVGTQGTICGGGRYDGLIESCGGRPAPGIGFGLGLERLLMEIESQGVAIPEPEGTEVFIASVGEKADLYAQSLVLQLRRNGVNAEKDHMSRSVRAQMKYADKLGAKYTVVIGEQEIETNKAVLRNMISGEEKDVSLDSIPERFKGKKSND